MRIGVLWKRRYMGHDVIADRYARLYELPSGLAESGHAVRVFCLAYRRTSPVRRVDAIAAPGELTWQGYNAGPFVIGGLPGYRRVVITELHAFKPDVLLGGSDALHVVLTHSFASRLSIPYVIDLYDNFESFGLTRLPGLLPLYRRALRQARAISAVSASLADYVRELAPGVLAIALESTIDPRVFVPSDRRAARDLLGLPADGRLIGVCGGLDRSRGIGLVYRAFLQLAASDPTLHLVLAGDPDPHEPPPDHPRLLKLGRIPHERMPNFYSALDLALVPMLDTPFGRYAFPQKSYEIMGCRTPILAARVGALAQTLANYPDCLYAPDDQAELETRIRGQLTAPVIPQIEIPSWREQAVRLEGVLADACGRFGGRRACIS
ncbi:glycosyltransferase family 4 protein [Thiocystis violascens]|uniref:Glycosyltransferase n=1 Tax=Thiocystis violascens (strain ATCC 17096 / DSM 198 / 6111) TaxID=765911 RepID=I3Y5E3_THIV6|nr:glycosyltransferase family 4 protein [Thiocystis violascens]AFL72211.1 glycosyltransferase [Thiocystis violascens DSM 198]